MLEELLEQFRQHDRFALARLLSLISRGESVDAIRSVLPDEPSSARVIAFTGSAGVGKSSLIGKLIEFVRQEEQTVAVLACDPQSSLTGGAFLGDRVRMAGQADDGVFIRSLAVPSGQQAIAKHLGLMIDLLKGFGFDVIVLETVGAGQGDTAVRDVADVLIVLLQPEAGDGVQWEKAGLLEVADIVVVHKADVAGAEEVEQQVREALNVPGGRNVPVIRASAAKSLGLQELWASIVSCPSRRREEPS